MKLIVGVFCFVLSTSFANAEDISPIFGSASQEPVLIKIDPVTGLPVAILEIPTPILVTTR